MPPLDIVYVLGNGSRWSNNEIRFSIRSVFRNLTGIGKIVIVGERPEGLKDYLHIDHPDEFGPGNADGNIIRKVLRACSDPRVSDKFLFINDDHIVMRASRVHSIPSFHKGDMTTYPESYWKLNPWRERLHLTMVALQEQNLTTLHFDCHTPIILEKGKFIDAMSRFDYASGVGLTMKSLYGNIHCAKAPCLEQQKKTVFKHFTIDQLQQRFEKASFLSFNDEGLNDSLRVFLHQRFPLPSPLETGPMEDKIIEIYIACRESLSYDYALETFLKYSKNNNLKMLFKSDRNNRFDNKLKYLLEQKLIDL